MDIDPHELAVAEWALKTHGEAAGAGTQTLSNVKVFFMPMKTLDENGGRYRYRG